MTTTPRNAIGLSEPATADLLRGCITQSNGIDLRDPQLLRSAATQLDALEEQVFELRHGVEDQMQEAAYHKERRAEAESRATRLQQERDDLSRVMEDTANELGCPSDNEAILEAIARLRQERDEAYEALKPFAEFDHATTSVDPDRCVIARGRIPSKLTLAHFNAARDCVRRLASVTEKEKTNA